MESVFLNIPMIWYIVSRTSFFHNHNVHNTCKTITNVPDIESLWTTYVNLIIFLATGTCMSKSPPYTQKSNEDWKPKLTPFEYTFTNFIVPKHVLMVEKGKFNIPSTDKLHFIVMKIGERSWFFKRIKLLF